MAQDTSAALRIIFSANSEQLDAALGVMQQKLTKVGKSLKNTGRNLTRNVTAPIAAVAGASIKTASDFEFAMAKVRAVSGFGETSMKALADSAKDFGARTAFSAREVAGLQENLAKLGFSSGEIIELTDGVLSLAQAFDLDLGDAAEKVALNLNRFGLEASEAGRVADVMATAFASSALDADKLEESLKMVGPVAKQAGFSIEQTSAILGVLADNGISGSIAGVGLSKVLTILAKEGGDTKTAFNELLQDASTIPEAFNQFKDRAGKLIPILQENSDKIGDLTEKFNASEGAAAKARKAMEDTTQGALKRLSSGMEAAAISIGEALLPVFTKLVDGIINLVGQFNELAPAQRKIILIVGGLAAAIGPLLLVMGQLTIAIGAMSGAMASAGLSLTAALGPIGLVVAAISTGLVLSFRQAGADAAAYRQEQERLNRAVAGFPDQLRDQAKTVEALDKAYNDLSTGVTSVFGTQGLAEGPNGLSQEIKDNLIPIFSDARAMAYEEGQRIRQEMLDQGKSLRDAGAARDRYINSFANARVKEYLKTQREIAKADLEAAQAAYQNEQVTASQKAEVRSTKAELEAFKDEQLKLKNAGEGLALSQDQYLRTLISKWRAYARAQVIAGENSGVAQKEIKRLTKELDALSGSSGLRVFTAQGGLDFSKHAGDLEKMNAAFSEQLVSIESAFSVTGDQETRLVALARAYEQAAIKATALGDVELGKQFAAEGKIYERQAQQFKANATNADNLRKTLFELGYTAADVAGLSITELLALLDKVKIKTKETSNSTKGLTQDFQQFAEQIVQGALSFFDSFAQGIGQAVEDAKASGEKMKSIGSIAATAFAGVLDTLGGILIAVGKQAIATGAAIAGIKKALQNLNPAVAIAAGVALIALAGAVRGSLAAKGDQIGGNVPALARGGITDGPLLALIGDNPSGKEAVIPFERMGEFLQMAQGTQHTTVTGRLQGMDILLSNERAGLARNRTT